jgi:hypothetical protein
MDPMAPFVGLLGEVVGELGVAQVPAHPPDVGLRLGHEPVERHTIAIARRNEQTGQVVHAVSFAALGSLRAVTIVSFDRRDSPHSREPSGAGGRLSAHEASRLRDHP